MVHRLFRWQFHTTRGWIQLMSMMRMVSDLCHTRHQPTRSWCYETLPRLQVELPLPTRCRRQTRSDSGQGGTRQPSQHRGQGTHAMLCEVNESSSGENENVLEKKSAKWQWAHEHHRKNVLTRPFSLFSLPYGSPETTCWWLLLVNPLYTVSKLINIKYINVSDISYHNFIHFWSKKLFRKL